MFRRAEDARFIATSRSAVPALLDEVERLRDALRTAEAMVVELSTRPPSPHTVADDGGETTDDLADGAERAAAVLRDAVALTVSDLSRRSSGFAQGYLEFVRGVGIDDYLRFDRR